MGRQEDTARGSALYLRISLPQRGTKEATEITKGMAHPGFFYMDTSGIIRDEAKYVDRFTPNNLLSPDLGAGQVAIGGCAS